MGDQYRYLKNEIRYDENVAIESAISVISELFNLQAVDLDLRRTDIRRHGIKCLYHAYYTADKGLLSHGCLIFNRFILIQV